jgi:AbrB family looped-hinge helix DNA binding protein
VGLVRITSKGQVTIPQAIREQAGLMPNTEVEFLVQGDVVTLMKVVRAKRDTRGAALVARLRQGRRDITMTTDEIMALTRGDD